VIALSSRFALPTALALCLLLAPVVYHGLQRPRVEDCADPAALEIGRFAPASERTRAQVAPARGGGAHRFGSLETGLPWKNDPLWNVVRSYDLGESYFLPPGRLSLSSGLEESRVVVREVDGTQVPVHLRVERLGDYVNVAAHVYVFGGRPVRTPLLASLREAWPQLLHGTLPLTSIVAEGDARASLAPQMEDVLVEWLLSAWSQYDEVCRR